jgi:hypothetical protein
LGDSVGCFEADAIDVTFELIGISLYSLKRRIPIRLVDLDRQVGADPVTMQKDHDLFNLFLLLPCAGDLLHPPRANARHFEQSLRSCLDHSKGLFFKISNNAFGKARADPFDHT